MMARNSCGEELDRVNDHDGGERRLGHERQGGRQQEQRGERGEPDHQAGELGSVRRRAG